MLGLVRRRERDDGLLVETEGDIPIACCSREGGDRRIGRTEDRSHSLHLLYATLPTKFEKLYIQPPIAS